MPNVRTVWSNAWNWLPRGAGVDVPPEMGTPRSDQLQGSDLDKVAELCGRVCYDSLGQGRSSIDYHKHISDVRHHSVYRHAALCLRLTVPPEYLADVCLALVNRPGVFVSAYDPDSHHMRFVASAQAALEWLEWDAAVPSARARLTSQMLGHRVAFLFKLQAPLTFQHVDLPRLSSPLFADLVSACPRTDDEVCASLFFDGVSRGLTHELVRHTFLCAPSQESTRYVDKEDDPWCPHPHLTTLRAKLAFERARDFCREQYLVIREEVENDLKNAGADKFTARKQARGAARGVLGNALGTRIIFTAPLAQWDRIFKQRVHPAADAEIREAMTLAKRAVDLLRLEMSKISPAT